MDPSSSSSIIQRAANNMRYFDLHERITILNYLKNMYCNKKFPTYDDIYNLLLKDHELILQYADFQQMMIYNEFEQKNTLSGTQMVIENPNVVFERFHYLKKITTFRLSYGPIYFIDERWVGPGLTFPKPLDGGSTNKQNSDGFIFLHAVSVDGFVNGVFCSPATNTDIINWLTQILLPLIKESSIIVLNNSYFHSSNQNKITKYHSKKDMLQYLRQKNIPCDEKLHKAELYELIDKCSDKNVPSHLEQILKAHNHQVLRLPSRYYDLSLTEVMWKHLRQSKLEYNNNPMHLKTNILDTCNNISRKIWLKLDVELQNLEKYILNIDFEIEEALEKNYNFCDHLPT